MLWCALIGKSYLGYDVVKISEWWPTQKLFSECRSFDNLPQGVNSPLYHALVHF